MNKKLLYAFRIVKFNKTGDEDGENSVQVKKTDEVKKTELEKKRAELQAKKDLLEEKRIEKEQKEIDLELEKFSLEEKQIEKQIEKDKDDSGKLEGEEKVKKPFSYTPEKLKAQYKSEQKDIPEIVVDQEED